MKIELQNYPEIARDLVDTVKIEHVFSEESLIKIRKTMVEEFKDELWREWDWLGKYTELTKVALGDVAIKRDAYTKVFENMDVTLGEFRISFPEYFEEIELLEKDYNDFIVKVSMGTAEVKLGEEIFYE